MADTVITNAPARDDGTSALGWIVALIIVLMVAIAAFLWFRRDVPAPADTAGATINVELPIGGSDAGAQPQ